MPIVTTKLYQPRLRPNIVIRPRLIERLNEGLYHKLTLISAPAGFGKTTLVSAWAASIERAVAWLSLDEGENDPTGFLTYLIAALQTIVPTIGEGVLHALQASQPPPLETLLATLLNELVIITEPFVLVLDDYHVIEALAVDQALASFVEHLPPQMHLVITTREDPRLPLARLRARDHVTELRAADLRFTTSEAAAFLTQVMDLPLSAADIARLSDRTEGWIVGLQLAALSMQGHQDISGFIQTFAGDHRYIVDYLVEEVLQHQTAPLRNFLLQTSILDQLSGSLCDAVTGQQEGDAQLEALERGNYFVIPLDDTRHWYRYHHLFAEVLSAHLMAEQATLVSTLHRRASGWYEQHGSATYAIRHALSALDFERAADLIELAVPAMRRSRQDAILLGWFKALPDEVVHFRPVLSVGYAYALLSDGDLEGAEARLSAAERWLDTTADTNELAPAPSATTCSQPFDDVQESLQRRMVVVDEEEFRRLPGAIAIYRAARAQALGDGTNTMKYARRALSLVSEDDHLLRGPAVALLGLASWASGDLETAYQAFADGLVSVQRAGNLSDAISGTIALADIRIAQGRLHEAMRTYKRSLQEAIAPGEPVLRGTADLYVGMSELYREQNDLDTAWQHLLKSKELGERTGFPQNRSRWCVALARIREAQGDLDGALDLLHESERLYVRDFFPNVHPIAARVSRVWVAQGRLDEAFDWAREIGLSAHDAPCYLREFAHITLGRMLLAQSKSDCTEYSMLEAMELLERLLHAAEEGKRTGSIIEILMLQALAHQMQGAISAALVPLERALMLAQPEGYVRIFVDEGAAMAHLLEAAAKEGIATNYVSQLLVALGSAENRTPIKQGLIDPLSQRELNVLRLLATDLNGPQIADELVVSLNTVRTHTKNIYSKLGVNNRRAAVHRAEELDLL
ncbi:LuxR C-terminal-related transcriptional regulator [Ktedonospora formicarum]|uniref:LuxR family transcriptional regulator n=1 Tax=Ktedonospora formicarum TaxID=2778364 RepID=A0A8J3MSX9_9CHLR|nr:LuxR C-terminal-related transcriptional regulator [Ktedonospora formicarum]GHO47577.1 LuxR family transcriptional regulator [Ktedonospora formicarum]